MAGAEELLGVGAAALVEENVRIAQVDTESLILDGQQILGPFQHEMMEMESEKDLACVAGGIPMNGGPPRPSAEAGPSWAQIVDGLDEPLMQGIPEAEIHQDNEDPCVHFSQEAMQRMSAPYHYAAVAGLLGGSSRSGMDYCYVFEVLRKQWTMVRRPRFSVIGNGRFLIRVDNEEEIRSVLAKRAWKVGARTLIASRWTPGQEMKITAEQTVLLWNEYSYQSMAKSINGVFVASDQCTTKREKLGFARIQIEVPVMFHPRPSIKLDLGDGRVIKQEIVYESRIIYCVTCGALTHLAANCRQKLDTNDSVNPEQSPWDKVTVRMKHKAPIRGGWGANTSSQAYRPHVTGMELKESGVISPQASTLTKAMDQHRMMQSGDVVADLLKKKPSQKTLEGQGSKVHPTSEPTHGTPGTYPLPLVPNPFLKINVANDKECTHGIDFPPGFSFLAGAESNKGVCVERANPNQSPNSQSQPRRGQGQPPNKSKNHVEMNGGRLRKQGEGKSTMVEEQAGWTLVCQKKRKAKVGIRDETPRWGGENRNEDLLNVEVVMNETEGAVAQRDIISLLNEVKPDVVFLLDTLVNEAIIKNIALRTGFEGVASNQQQAEGIARIACFWRMDRLSAVQCQASRWWIELAFNIGDHNSLVEEINKTLCPTIVMGDCNAMRSQGDKTDKALNPQSCRLFNDFIYDSNLQEIQGPPNAFTWSNRRQGDECILCKIDWCFINQYGANNLPLAYFLEHKARPSSDYKAMVLELRDQRLQERRKRRFRFFKPWLNDSRAKEIINEAWATTHYGCPMLRVLGKLSEVKKRLNRWNREDFGRIDEKVKSLVQGELYEQIKHDRHLSLKDAINYYRVYQNYFPFLLNGIRELSDRDDRLVFKIDANQEITSSLVWNMYGNSGGLATKLPMIIGSTHPFVALQIGFGSLARGWQRRSSRRRRNGNLFNYGVWWDSDAGTYKAASRVAHGGEDIAEMHLLECWLGQHLLLYGQQDGRNDGG
ncbi:hypothetical protein EJ110_NYTH27264 [Nymphaea thermarum]|nr:hypothetical protein EJ110_NYTH27264 [Nymphaea thermarum]